MGRRATWRPIGGGGSVLRRGRFPSFKSWSRGERKKKIANLKMLRDVKDESQTDPAFDESQSKEIFALWSEIFKNISPCKMTIEKKMCKRKD